LTASPDSRRRADYVHEQAVESGIRRQFRVEAGGQQSALSNGHDGTRALTMGDLSEDFHIRTNALHPRRANEHRMEVLVAEDRNRDVGLEGIDLPTESIATNDDA
jgi:hypothetical protein